MIFLLILLCYYASSDANAINELCDSLLFIHSFTCCDTTSNVFGNGKELTLKKYLKMTIFVNVPVFTKSKAISIEYY